GVETRQERWHGLRRDVVHDVQHVRGRDLTVTLERARVGLLVGDVVDPEPGRRPARQRYPSRVHVEAADEAARPGRRVVEREQPEAAADIEDRTRLGQILADLV